MNAMLCRLSMLAGVRLSALAYRISVPLQQFETALLVYDLMKFLVRLYILRFPVVGTS